MNVISATLLSSASHTSHVDVMGSVLFRLHLQFPELVTQQFLVSSSFLYQFSVYLQNFW